MLYVIVVPFNYYCNKGIAFVNGAPSDYRLSIDDCRLKRRTPISNNSESAIVSSQSQAAPEPPLTSLSGSGRADRDHEGGTSGEGASMAAE